MRSNNYRAYTNYNNDEYYLIKLYMGKKYDQVMNHKYPFEVLLLGPISLVYYNMLTQAFFFMCLLFITFLFIDIIYFPIVYLLFNIVLSLIFNTIYYQDTIYKLKHIFSRYKETNLIEAYLYSYHRTRWIVTIAYFAIFAFSISLSNTIFEQYRLFGNDLVVNRLYLNYPRDYTLNNNVITNKDSSCTISIYHNEMFDENKIIEFFGLNGNIEVISINNVMWKRISENNKTLYLYSYFNDSYYLLAENTNNTKSCSSTIESIVSTIEFKGGSI